MTAPRKRRLAAYLRVSTIEQTVHGFGLEAQRRAITAAAKTLDARIIKTFSDEGLSGTLPAEDRPELTAALTMIKDGKADGLIVRDLDRLARSVTVQEAILATVWKFDHAAVFTAVPAAEVKRDDPDDPMRTAMREMAGVFAGLERRLIVKRLRDGRKAKAAAGGHATGSPPYGWRSEKRSPTNPNGALVAIPQEQEVLTRMRELRSSGTSLEMIAQTLNAEGYPTKRHGRAGGAGQWHKTTVGRILEEIRRRGDH